MHERERPGDFGRDVDARYRLADDLVLGRFLDRRIAGQPEIEAAALDQLCIGDAMGRVVPRADDAIGDRELRRRHVQVLHRARDKKAPRLCRGTPQRYRGDLDGIAGDRRALVRRLVGIAEDDVHLVHRDIELLRDDLSKGGAYARAQIDMAAIDRDHTISTDGEKGVDRIVREDRWPTARERGSVCGRQRGRREVDGHHQRAGDLQELSAVGRVNTHHDGHRSVLLASAARLIAARISICVPQRHRFPASAARICCSVGSGCRSKSAFAVMIMPLVQ
jgi:hypothetical protein